MLGLELNEAHRLRRGGTFLGTPKTCRTVVRIFVLLCASAGFACIPQDDQVRQEVKRLKGTWKVISLKVFGEESKDKRDKEAEYTFKGNKLFINRPEEKEPTVTQTYRLDLAKDPRHFDLDGPGGTAKGIYSLQGDSLTICLPFPFVTKDRPTKLESDQGGKAALMVLKRSN